MSQPESKFSANEEGGLKELIKRRSVIRGRLTRFKDYISNYEKMDRSKISELNVNELSMRITAVRELLVKFDSLQTDIESLSDDIDQQLIERDATESLFYSLLCNAQQFVDSVPAHHKEQINDSVESNKSQFNSIKLPIITLPHFDGNYLRWLEFKDTFDSLINSNDAIPNINKFHYLRSSLEGSASVVIKSIEFTSENYGVAWKILCERFDNKTLLINNHLKALFSLEPVSRESYKALRFIIDHISKNLRALNTLGQPTDKWDTLIIYMVSTKLDSQTSRKWEEYKNSLSELPTLDEFNSFLRNRANVLETTENFKIENKPVASFRSSNQRPKAFVVSTLNNRCHICNQNHLVYECSKFKNMSINDRIKHVNKLSLCEICLRTGHLPAQCKLRGSCRTCKGRHNTLVHRDDIPVHSSIPSDVQSALPVALPAVRAGQVLLCTAIVNIIIGTHTYRARALLDSGSQTSFITQGLQRKLNLVPINTKPINISGINNATLNISKRCTVELVSRVKEFTVKTVCLIVPTITNYLPNLPIEQKIDIPGNVELADPTFRSPSEIDLLLGADVYWDIVGTDKIRLGSHMPILHDSMFGWLVVGPIGEIRNESLCCNFVREVDEVDNLLRKFWEIDEMHCSKKSYSLEENLCEKHFLENTRRLSNGRFSVKMPFKENPEEALGDSYLIAKKRFLNLESKLSKDPFVKEKYCQFIKEYKDLGHLTEIQRPRFGCYLPHHAVMRERSDTTKLRTVFDASSKTSSGKSLNDIQLVGPVVQSDLLSILLRFRTYKYVLTGDIEKMYRQILIDESQRHLQIILWRENPDEYLKLYQLNTVTYGTASAPFLSTRCLVQLAEDCTDSKIANIIKNDFYMDDMNTGADSIDELQYIYTKITETLDSACFPLRKFRTNCLNFNDNLCISDSLDLNKDSTILGLNWLPQVDILHFPNSIDTSLQVTKRNIISITSKIFDPLGLLCACIIRGKILLQRLWNAKLNWDDIVPPEFIKIWTHFINNLPYLSNLKIPRYVLSNNLPYSVVEIHCFVDASQEAFAGCLYIRCVDMDSNVTVRLLCAKARVAPIKPCTIPRLELCGALLGARLCNKVLDSLRCNITNKYIWTDSTVVLGWIKMPPRNLKAFVCNRVNEINDLTCNFKWRHVPTGLNPADLASRGVDPLQLVNCSLWWEGPPFLKLEMSEWPQYSHSGSSEILPELKVHVTVETFTKFIDFERFSNIIRLKRCIAYVLRFIYNLRNDIKLCGALTVDELNNATNIIIKASQMESFGSDIKVLNKGGQLHYKSKLISLHPFIDPSGILRVGGRLQNSNFEYNKKHPIVLDSNHHFAKLMMRNEHLKLFHTGPQHLLASVREKYWPIGGRYLARKTVRACVTCTRLKGKSTQPIMGNLPSVRTAEGFAFESCGIDLAGPFLVTSRTGRGSRQSKCYLCLFICLATKAVHLEVVSALSTEAFLLALRRFVARRGKPISIYCDNGTNFVGANAELGRVIRSSRHSVYDYSANEGIKFVFSPAYSPHFGGIWEAGIKSAKTHLKRVASNSSLTFEELTTLFTQIESILNSRPLSPLSSDPTDLSPLTPGHFLVGRPLTSVPSTPVTCSRPNRYQRVELLRQQFWERWRREYIAELQQRTKWRTHQRGLRVGDLVYIKEENLPPLRWRLGRVSRLYPGSDGTARVADVTTAKGVVKRANNRLCIIPSMAETEEEEDVRLESGCFQGGQDVRAYTEANDSSRR